MTKLTVESVARYFSVTKPTIRKHIEKGIITANIDEKGKRTIDMSEALRVYKLNEAGAKQFPEIAGKSDRDLPENASREDLVEVVKLRERVAGFEREREQLVDQVEFLKAAVDDEKEERRKLTMMVTDQREESEKEADRAAMQLTRIDEIEKRFEQKVELLQKVHSEDMASVKTQNAQIRKQNAFLVREVNKSLWDILFGPKKQMSQGRQEGQRPQRAQ